MQRENAIIVKQTKIMSNAFVHYNNFATLSLSLSQVLNRQSTTFKNIRALACKYTALPLAKLLMLGNVQASLHCARLLAAFHAFCNGKPHCFLSISNPF
jgi:hypothetical protein